MLINSEKRRRIHIDILLPYQFLHLLKHRILINIITCIYILSDPRKCISKNLMYDNSSLSVCLDLMFR